MAGNPGTGSPGGTAGADGNPGSPGTAGGEGIASNPNVAGSTGPEATLSVQTLALPSGSKHKSYSTKLTATGGYSTYKWSLKMGKLPSGLKLSSSGTISGTPTATAKTARFTVKVADVLGSTATKVLTIVVA
jgi:hypothetical protein